MTHVTELETEASRPLTPVAPRANGRVRTSRYRVLGEGSTLTLSILSIACMLGLWWLATNMGWIRPLFCRNRRPFGPHSSKPSPAISITTHCGCTSFGACTAFSRRSRWRS